MKDKNSFKEEKPSMKALLEEKNIMSFQKIIPE